MGIPSKWGTRWRVTACQPANLEGVLFSLLSSWFISIFNHQTAIFVANAFEPSNRCKYQKTFVFLKSELEFLYSSLCLNVIVINMIVCNKIQKKKLGEYLHFNCIVCHFWGITTDGWFWHKCVWCNTKMQMLVSRHGWRHWWELLHSFKALLKLCFLSLAAWTCKFPPSSRWCSVSQMLLTVVWLNQAL